MVWAKQSGTYLSVWRLSRARDVVVIALAKENIRLANSHKQFSTTTGRLWLDITYRCLARLQKKHKSQQKSTLQSCKRGMYAYASTLVVHVLFADMLGSAHGADLRIRGITDSAEVPGVGVALGGAARALGGCEGDHLGQGCEAEGEGDCETHRVGFGDLCGVVFMWGVWKGVGWESIGGWERLYM